MGRHAARFLTEQGAVLIGAADSQGAVHDPNGLDVAGLLELKEQGGSVVDLPGAVKLAQDAVIDMECDIWIPAARPDVIHIDNVQRLRTKLVVQGANIPFAEEAEKVLFERGVVVVPDFIANAGGVICAAVEFQGETQSMAFQVIEEKIRANTRQVLEEAAAGNIMPRQAAVALSVRRVKKAMECRRWALF